MPPYCAAMAIVPEFRLLVEISCGRTISWKRVTELPQDDYGGFPCMRSFLAGQVVESLISEFAQRPSDANRKSWIT